MSQFSQLAECCQTSPKECLKEQSANIPGCTGWHPSQLLSWLGSLFFRDRWLLSKSDCPIFCKRTAGSQHFSCVSSSASLCLMSSKSRAGLREHQSLSEEEGTQQFVSFTRGRQSCLLLQLMAVIPFARMFPECCVTQTVALAIVSLLDQWARHRPRGISHGRPCHLRLLSFLLS